MQTNRVVFAFLLSMIVIIGYHYVSSKYFPAPPAQEQLAQRAEDQAVSAVPESKPRAIFTPKTAPQGKDIEVETDLIKVVLTSSGARIKSCQLKRHPEENIQIQGVKEQLKQLELAQGRAADTATEKLLQRRKAKLETLLLKLEQDSQGAELVSLAADVDTDFFPEIRLSDDEKAHFLLNSALYQYSSDGLLLNAENPEGRLEFIYSDTQGHKIKKVYTFSNSNYGIGLDIYFSSWPQGQGESLEIFLGPDVGMPQAQETRRMQGYRGPISCLQSGRQTWAVKENYGREEKAVFVQRSHQRSFQHREGTLLRDILWTGLSSKYFLAALIPAQRAEAVLIEKNSFGEQKAGLFFIDAPLDQYNFTLYLGPKKEIRLREVNATLENSIDYGFFGPIARFIYRSLVFFSLWTHNFGWAIVLLCLVTKVVFYPLTHRSFEAMQKMQQHMKELQPEMNALRERHKDNPQRLNKEVMELYRKKGINPLASCQSGCLPLILQMPVFFALYVVLYNSIELRGEPFLGWIRDLSAKDPYYILPVLMGVSMYAQQKLTGMGQAAGPQQDQAKMMSVVMPIVLTWVFASLPSGVVLYWLTFNILTALQQLIIRKKQKGGI